METAETIGAKTLVTGKAGQELSCVTEDFMGSGRGGG